MPDDHVAAKKVLTGRYYTFSAYLQELFGQKVYKIPLSLGIPCPNKDGTISREGCIFCDEFGSGPMHFAGLSLKEQLEHGSSRILKKHKAGKFIAYFQAHTSTAAPLEFFRAAVDTALEFPDMVGISIGTRPDCLPDPYLEYLEELNQKTLLWVELGLQSIHAESLAFLRRNHTLADFTRSFQELKKRGIHVCAHVILGIPGEGEKETAEAARFLSGIGVHGVKIHPLHVLKNTALEKLYREQRFIPMEFDEYVRLAVIFLENLAPSIVIQRLTGEREKEIFVAPAWALDKGLVIKRINDLLASRDSYQGKALI